MWLILETVNKLLQQRNTSSIQDSSPIIQLILWVFVYNVCGCMSTFLPQWLNFMHAFSTISYEHYWKSVHTLPPSLPRCWKLWGHFSPVNVTHQSYQRWSRSLKPTQVPPQGEVYPNPSITLRCFKYEPFYSYLPYLCKRLTVILIKSEVLIRAP